MFLVVNLFLFINEKQVFFKKTSHAVYKSQTFIMTVFFVDDPTEQNDLAQSKPDIVKKLRQRLQMLTKNALPPNYPLVPDPKSDPTHFDNVWSPGWCWNTYTIINIKFISNFECNQIVFGCKVKICIGENESFLS